MPRHSPDSQHIVVAAIIGSDGRLLIARRPDHLHQGGLWELPGGKVEEGEVPTAALLRELQEEVGIEPTRYRPFIQLPFSYTDRTLVLEVWLVEQFLGHPTGREGQQLAWVEPQHLAHYAFPPANRGIIRALQLPSRYLITPDPGPVQQWPRFLAHLDRCLGEGIALVQLRAKGLDEETYRKLAVQVLGTCREGGSRLIVNGHVRLVGEIGADGVHLTTSQLQALNTRPLPDALLVSAACHNRQELEQAATVGVDFALLSPVSPTQTHPDMPHLGWQSFAELVAKAAFPIYALGGLSESDLTTAWSHGGHGIAAITGLWNP